MPFVWTRCNSNIRLLAKQNILEYKIKGEGKYNAAVVAKCL